MKKKSHITITGVTGFVGSNLFEYFLDENIEITASNLRNLNWKSEIDTEVSAIIHLAGKAHDLKNNSNLEEYFMINTKLTQELFDFFLASCCYRGNSSYSKNSLWSIKTISRAIYIE